MSNDIAKQAAKMIGDAHDNILRRRKLHGLDEKRHLSFLDVTKLRPVIHVPVMKPDTPAAILEMLRLMRRGAQLSVDERSLVLPYIYYFNAKDEQHWRVEWDGTDKREPCPYGDCKPFPKDVVDAVEAERDKVPSLLIKPSSGIVKGRALRRRS